MKTLVILATLVATASIAAAQPALTAATPAPAAEPSSYFAAGGVYGAAPRTMFIGASFEYGAQIRQGPLWFHAQVVAADAGEIDDGPLPGTLLQGRVGIEARDCSTAWLCMIASVDGAVTHTQYMSDDASLDRVGAMVIPRVGFDVGTQYLRVRPTIELGVDSDGMAQLAVTATVAYRY
ncbi:MAG TPA: hypothetical protein VGF94_24235 [Kofleriaceae bacterium]|jgi:hypothetical protein